MQVFICKASKSHLYGNQSVSYIPLNGPGCANKKMILIRGLLLLSKDVAVKEMQCTSYALYLHSHALIIVFLTDVLLCLICNAHEGDTKYCLGNNLQCVNSTEVALLLSVVMVVMTSVAVKVHCACNLVGLNNLFSYYVCCTCI